VPSNGIRLREISGGKSGSRQHDLLFSTDVLAAALLGHHARIGAEADGGVVPELRGDLNPRQPALVDQERRERMPQVVPSALPMSTVAATGLKARLRQFRQSVRRPRRPGTRACSAAVRRTHGATPPDPPVAD
jgi:hypothetical protein